MIKRLYYIILILVFVPLFSFATIKKGHFHFTLAEYTIGLPTVMQTRADTIVNKRSKKQREEDEKNKIKEIAKAKKQAKPEKVDDEENGKKRKQRRPEGMERPPEIIRRNGG